ncbi:MAG TPA: NADH-quinone oxidoreductase subunit L, partial [Actinomycetota bacterium]|nr:NADH-quinone oxidoreductase subunit L [Actinomycetota bacterium]
MIDLIWLAVALPLIASGVNMLVGKRFGSGAGDGAGQRSGWFATAAMAASFVVALGALLSLLSLPSEERTQVVSVAEWIRAGAVSVSFDLRVDPLSITMALVVTGVGSLIHLYAIGYMEHDPRPWRFFGYTTLFCAFMLVLVLADDFLLLYL